MSEPVNVSVQDAPSESAAKLAPSADADQVTSTKAARPTGVALAELGVALGDKIEVLWDVEMTDGSEDVVWWGATIGADADAGADAEEPEAGRATLLYEAMGGFEEETRRVLFLGGGYLWDAALRERMPYKREGEAGPPLDKSDGDAAAAGAEDEEEEASEETSSPAGASPETLAAAAFAVGDSVKARFQNGDKWCAGTIQGVNADGTFNVLYEDHVLEESVPGDVIAKVEIDTSVQQALASGGAVAAESSEAFFELFVTSLTSGPMFAKLSPEQQAHASDKVRKLRPHFEAELNGLREARGWGAIVTDVDIKTIIPRVMMREKQAAMAAAV